MQVDYLIIGQGISGTWLSYYLDGEQASFRVIDHPDPNTPSRLAAGIINPVTGRRHVEVWMADKILPFSHNAYRELGEKLGITAISRADIIDFFPTPQMRLSFQQRVEESGAYVSLDESPGDLRRWFNYDFGYGEISPVYLAQLKNILPAWREKLKNDQTLLEEVFQPEELEVFPDHIRYRDIRAEKIIFCDGSRGSSLPYFSRLPFAPNKGEALILEIPELPADRIYKKGLILAPLSSPGQWWVGSNYAWEFDHENPTLEFRSRTEELLKSWLLLPFAIRDHICGIRPATLERRPFVGIHPRYPSLGILNGMGTKGCSLAPFFAKQLTGHLLRNNPITPEADIRRFSGILSRD